MANSFVIKDATAERVPFLRGVLVQSVMSASLSPQDAHAVARALRSELQDAEEMTTAEGRTRALA